MSRLGLSFLKNVDGFIANICLFILNLVDELPYVLKYYDKYVFDATVNNLSYLISIDLLFLMYYKYISASFRL